MLKNPPETVWLQYHGEDGLEDGPVDMADITWSNEQIFGSDIQYIRADVARRADKRVIKILQNDAFAMSFQSLGQYRSAVMKAIRATIPED